MTQGTGPGRGSRVVRSDGAGAGWPATQNATSEVVGGDPMGGDCGARDCDQGGAHQGLGFGTVVVLALVLMLRSRLIHCISIGVPLEAIGRARPGASRSRRAVLRAFLLPVWAQFTALPALVSGACVV